MGRVSAVGMVCVLLVMVAAPGAPARAQAVVRSGAQSSGAQSPSAKSSGAQSNVQTAAQPNDVGRVIATGGLIFVQDPAIAVDQQDVAIAIGEIKVTYVLRNTTAGERTILAAFPLPELDSAAGSEQPIRLSAPQTANFVSAAVTVDGTPVQPEFERRALALGLDVTALLAAHQVPLQPFDPATSAYIKRMPRATRLDFLQRGIVRQEDDRTEPNWALRTTAFWRQAFPPRKQVSIVLSYRSITATAPYQPSLLEAVRPTHCLDAAAEAAITRKLAAKGNTVAFTWSSFVPGSASSLIGPIRNFRLRLEKPSFDSVVVTCRSGFRPLGPTTFEWAAQNYQEEDLHVLFID